MDGFDGFVTLRVNPAARRILDSVETDFAELLETGGYHLLEVVQNAGNIPSGCGASPVTGLRGKLNEYGLHGSELLNDNPAVEFHDLGAVLKPLQRGFVL